ncbi:MAG: YdcF family protein [Xenococcaceae cyanobacterium MO_188.B29]|nr:YdcF family protein [Xenococcaceae cyanobacterium MO_188.B29]
MRQDNFRVKLTKKIRRSLKQVLLIGCLLLTINLLFNLLWKLPHNSSKPVDAFFVLGGSINREIYVAQLAKKHPEIPILISHGSDDPCIFLVFQREQAPLNRVWLEKCAESTFGNFFFSLPLLTKWNVHKVKLITSATHLPRAKWLANILLGSHGISLELDIAPEKGVPGNYESPAKTLVDLIRSVFWALGSQIIQPPCSQVDKLSATDMPMWYKKGFTCERQAGLDY